MLTVLLAKFGINKYIAYFVMALMVVSSGWLLYKSHVNGIVAQATLQMNNKTLTKALEDMKEYNRLTKELLESQQRIEQSLSETKETLKDNAEKTLEIIEKSADKDRPSSDVLKNTIKSLGGK